MAQFAGAAVVEEWVQIVGSWADTHGSWLYKAHHSIRGRSKFKGWDKHITPEELRDITLRSNGRCAISGLPFDREKPDGKRNPFGISIDRIDASQGYVVGNVRLVCLIVNLAMSHWGETAVKRMSRALVGQELFAGLVQTPLHVQISSGSWVDQLLEKVDK